MDKSRANRDDKGKNNKNIDETQLRFREQQRKNERRDKRHARRDALRTNLRLQVSDTLISFDKAELAQARAERRESRNKKRNRTLEEIEINKVVKAQKKAETYYIRRSTLNLSVSDYRNRFGTAKIAENLQQNKPDEWQQSYEAICKNDGVLKGFFLDFDGSFGKFTETADQTAAVDGYLHTLKILADKGYRIGIITGRPIEGTKRRHLATGEATQDKNGILDVLARSGADEALLNKIEIAGSQGAQHRGRDTNYKVVIRSDIEEFVEPQERVLNYIEELIKNNDKLKGLPISIEEKPIGATIHYQEVDASKHEEVKRELENLLSNVLPEKSDNENFPPLEDQNNADYKKFTYNDARKSYEIRLNPATGVVVHKGISVKTLAEDWRLKVALTVGDDTTDLDMLTNLEKCGLTAVAFVAVKHDDTPQDLINGATVVVEGQECATGLLREIANKAEDQTLIKDQV
jgi:trehalose-6-phosphatase